MIFLKRKPTSMKKALKPSFEMADDPALALGNAVLTGLTGNTYFPVPSPTLADLQTAVDVYTASLSKAKNGSRADKEQKNLDKQGLISLLRDECDYVNMIAKGDVLTLLTTRFNISKDRQPRVLGTPEAKVENGTSGKLLLSTPAVAGALAYKHKYKANVNAATWFEIYSTRAKCVIEGLTPGIEYELQIEAIGTKNQVTISNIVTKMAA